MSKRVQLDGKGLSSWRALGLAWALVLVPASLLGTDADGDGFTDSLEARYDWNASLADDRRKGGIVRARSAMASVRLGTGGGVVQVTSDPAGLLPPSSTPLENGQSFSTPTADSTVGNMRFLFWERNGQAVRSTGDVPPPAATEDNVGTGVSLVAHYLEESVDSDADGLKDWFEMKKAGDLSPTPQADDDADGFSLRQEQDYGFNPHIKDTRTRGGVTRSRSQVVAVSLGGGGVLEISSDPPGLVQTVSHAMLAGDVQQTEIVPNKIGNKRFLYWERMGQPVRSVAGIPIHQVTESQIGSGVELVAKFESEDKDGDQDGLPDWLEKRTGSLALNPSSDPDGDGFGLALEHRYGFSPFLADLRTKGGITRRRSVAIPLGAGNGTAPPPAPPDLDGDGIPDQLDFDTDGDGSSDAEELTNGTNPRDANSHAFANSYSTFLNGNLSLWLDASDLTQAGTTWTDKSGHNRHATMHGSPEIVANFQNGKPVMRYGTDSLDYHSFPQQTDIRTVFWVLRSEAANNAPLLGDSQVYHLHASTTKFLHSSHPHANVKQGLLRLDGTTVNGVTEDKPNAMSVISLRTTGNVTASNFSRDRTSTSHHWKGELAELLIFNAPLSDQMMSEIEGYLAHKWALTNRLPQDHPHKATAPYATGALGNSPPTTFTINKTVLMENQAAGIEVGKFSATDPDQGASLRFALATGTGNAHNHLFSIDGTGTLRTSGPLDRESESHHFVRVAALDEFNASVERIFTIRVLDDPGEENLAPTSISLSHSSVEENKPAHSPVGQFGASDPNSGDVHSFAFVQGTGDTHNHLFSLTSNGLLKTAASLDYEAMQTVSIRVRAVDPYGKSIDANFNVSILDLADDPPVNPPTVENNQTDSPSDPNATDPPVEDNTTSPEPPHPGTQAYLPIVRTESIVHSTDDLLRFEGTILTDGGPPILESGFLVGQSINLLPNVRLPAQPNASSNEFSASAQPGQFEPGNVYFFRAYARNALGESLGSIRQFRTPEPSPDTWWAQMPAIGAGWHNSEWLGTFRPYDNGWIYHAKLGWAYVATDGKQGLWLWTEGNGWLWTQPGVYPYLWKHRSGNWLYLLGTRNGNPVFFDFATNSAR
ncbi:MAG: cadherin repeat domain-containing protein [Opitutae bacterium]|nr:cadherin repeat domain-containing protein [Opitutae bacterium]